MKSIIASLSALLLAATVSARVGLGGCPKFTTVPFSASMNIVTPVYFHYVDLLVANGYSLGNLLFANTYETLDCYRLDDGIVGLFGSPITESIYADIVAEITSADNPFVAGITYFDASTGTFMAQACVDITTVSTYLTNIIAGGDIPQIAITAIAIGTWLLKFVHFQVTVIASETQTLTTAIQDTWAAELLNLPGSVPIGYLSQLDVTTATCAWA